MEAKNFRIGNWVNGEYRGFSKDVKIYGMDKKDIQHTSESVQPLPSENFRPIPLTPEWIVNLGFSGAYHKLSGEHSHLPSFYNLNGFQIDVEYYVGSDEVCYYEFHLHPSTELKYVHQLQNLFFAIMNTELELKNVSSTCS